MTKRMNVTVCTTDGQFHNGTARGLYWIDPQFVSIRKDNGVVMMFPWHVITRVEYTPDPPTPVGGKETWDG